MRLVLGSDLHGYLPEVPPCDVLVLAGDIMPANHQRRFYSGSLKRWLDNIPAHHIVAIWGNHDWPYNIQGLPNLRWHMLVDKATILDGVTFYGSPWSLPFYEWAWQAPEETLIKLYSFIPDNTDVLISHTPPLAMCDKNNEGFHSGSKSLYDRMAKLPQLKLLVCGHIHEAHGQSDLVVNASCMTRNMQLRTDPWITWEL